MASLPAALVEGVDCDNDTMRQHRYVSNCIVQELSSCRVTCCGWRDMLYSACLLCSLLTAPLPCSCYASVFVQSVPLMLTAVQQLLDALSALGITYKLLATTQQLQPQQAHTAPAAPHQTSRTSSTSDSGGGSSSSSSGGGRVTSASECVQWQQQLLLHELVEPMHGSFCGLLEALSGLVVLVQEHVRRPTEASKAALHKEVSSADLNSLTMLICVVTWSTS